MSGNRLGALLMLLGMAAFAMNDALGKWLVADYGVAQVILLRSLAAGVMMVPFLLRGWGADRRRATTRAFRHCAPPAPRPRCSCSTLPCPTCRWPR